MPPIMIELIRKAIPLGKWVISGGIAVGVDLTALFIFVEFFNLHYLAAASIAFLLSATTNYTISRLAIFQDAQHSIPRSYTTFMGISLFGLGAINVCMFVLVGIFSVHYILARTFLAGTLGVSSFFLHKYFSFKDIKKS